MNKKKLQQNFLTCVQKKAQWSMRHEKNTMCAIEVKFFNLKPVPAAIRGINLKPIIITHTSLMPEKVVLSRYKEFLQWILSC